MRNTSLYPIGFVALVLGYCALYAPYGINETDGGFITSLAWQVLSGKKLYTEVWYVRPPLPIWMRAAEIILLPDWLELIAERWIFYCKMAVIAAFSASWFCTHKNSKWLLAIYIFLVSVHCYPGAAWHTVDGVFFAALALHSVQKRQLKWCAAAGLFALCSELSKQVFLVVPALILGYLMMTRHWRGLLTAFLMYAFGKCAFFALLLSSGTLTTYQTLTSGAASFEALVQHGIRDFLSIAWPLRLSLLLLWGLLISIHHESTKKYATRLLLPALIAFVLFLIGLLAYQTYQRQEFTAPFAQARALWWFGLGYFAISSLYSFRSQRHTIILLGICTAINWASAVSWGYNLPIFFPVAGIAALYLCFETYIVGHAQRTWQPGSKLSLIGIATLFILFWYGYQFVYRDGHRTELRHKASIVYPQFYGIKTDAETLEKYTELKQLQTTYPECSTLPTVTLADYLGRKHPALPLNWVVRREMGNQTPVIHSGQIFLIEAHLLERIDHDTEYAFTRSVKEQSEMIDRTQHFLVVRIR